MDVEGEKIYNFCRKHFSVLSKKDLRKCLLDKTIFVNEQPVRGALDATLRLHKGDMVKIIWDNDSAKRRKLQNIEIDVMHQDSSVIIVNKPPGTNAAAGRLFDEAVKSVSTSAFCEDKRYDCFLWRLQKSIGGLHVAVKNVSEMLHLRDRLCDESSRISCTCLVAGYAGEPNAEFNISIDVPTGAPPSSAAAQVSTKRTIECILHNEEEDYDEEEGGGAPLACSHSTPVSLQVKVLRTVPCRSTDFMSLIEVTPRFDRSLMGVDTHKGGEGGGGGAVFDLLRPSDAQDYTYLHYPTFVLRNIPRVLRCAGLPVVGGEDGFVKKDKALYMTVSGVCLTRTTLDPVEGGGGGGGDAGSNMLKVTLPLPEKMAKLMAKEAELHAASIERDMQIIRTARAVPLANATESSLYPPPADVATENPTTDTDMAYSADREALLRGMPVEYLLGWAGFCGLRFEVTGDVMIPRRSSECLVHAAVEAVVAKHASHIALPNGRIRVLDIGCGSGCLLLSVLTLLQQKGIDCVGVGIDICPKALAMAGRNAEALMLTKSVLFLQHSFSELPAITTVLDACVTDGSGKDVWDGRGDEDFDVILCNPPYSSPKEVRLSRSRASYEPAIALFAEQGYSDQVPDDALSAAGVANTPKVSFTRVRARNDPYRAFTTIVSSLSRALVNCDKAPPHTPLLSADGVFVLEFGHKQAARVRSMFERASCLQHSRTLLDYNGLERGMIFKRKNEGNLITITTFSDS